MRLWDLPSGRELPSLKGHSQTVTSLGFFPGGDHLASASLDGTARIWNWPEEGLAASKVNQPPTIIPTPGDKLHALAIDQDGRFLVVAGKLGKIYLHELKEPSASFEVDGHAKTVYALAISPNHPLVAAASEDGSVSLWHTPT